MSIRGIHALARRALLASLAAALTLAVAAASAQDADAVSLAGQTVLVTGSTDGLGREVARRLAGMGATVIVHGRNEVRGQAVVEEITGLGGEAVFYQADLASLEEVEALAQAVLDNHERLDLLINNAGIWPGGDDDGTRYESADGHELVFAVNYLSGYLLTHRLLPLLEASAPARIVNVASLAQRPIDFDDVMMERDYTSSAAYSQSKLAQVLFTIDLAEQLDDDRVTVNSLHPATLMDTTMVREVGMSPRASVDEGAEAVMNLAVSPDLEGRSGLYFDGLEEAEAHAQAYDPEARRKLRELSDRLTGLD